MTGLYPQTSGVVGFRQKEITSATMPRLLRDAGYATALVGREMHQSVGAAELGYQTEIRGSTYVSNDDYTADLKRAVPEMGEDPCEEHDLSSDADRRDLLEQWQNRLVQRLVNRPEGFSDGTRLIIGRFYPPVQAGIPR